MIKEKFILEKINTTTWRVYRESDKSGLSFDNYKSALRKFLELRGDNKGE